MFMGELPSHLRAGAWISVSYASSCLQLFRCTAMSADVMPVYQTAREAMLHLALSAKATHACRLTALMPWYAICQLSTCLAPHEAKHSSHRLAICLPET